jgi:hypothetical protein
LTGSVMQKHRPLPTGLALLFLTLLLASLAARFWATDRSGQFVGPLHIAADSQQVFLFASNNIYRLSPEGELLAQHPADETGILNVPIDLRITSDNHLLVAEQQPARIRSCDTINWACQDIGFGGVDEPKRQFKVLTNTPSYDLLFTDARGDSLRGLARPDSAAARLLPDKTLAGPNDLAIDSRGHLWVADTDHRRILELIPAPEGGFEVGREHSAMNELTRERRFYPIMLALGGDGKLWVTQATEFSDRYADLVIYDLDQGAVKQLTLPGSIFPTDVAATGEDILVTDLEMFTVYRVNTGSHEVSVFGDDRFRDAMARLRKEHDRYGLISQLAMGAVLAFGVLMVLAAVVSTPKNKRWTSVPGAIDVGAAPLAVPRLQGLYWLKRNSKVDRSLKWLRIMGSAFFIVMLAGGVALFVWVRMVTGEDPGKVSQELVEKLGNIFLLSGLLLAAMVPLLLQTFKAMKYRLGTDGKQLYVRLEDGREIVIPAVELAFTKQALFYEKYFIPLQTGKRQNLYQDGEVETWIVPLLHQAEKYSLLDGLKHQWKHQNALLGWALFSVVVIPLVLVLMSQLRT